MRALLQQVIERQDLSFGDAEDMMHRIMDGQVDPIVLSGLLTALQAKGPSVEEITAFAKVMREKAGHVPYDGKLVEIVGTGGDGAKTFNISTTAGFVVAGAGVPVAKHGNRSVSSACGAADVVEALGAALALNGGQNSQMLADVNMCFMFAPVYHESMKHAVPVRKALGVRTVFNILGPLSNPAGATVELMGVYDSSLVEPLAHVLAKLGITRGVVVHGSDGLDEITATGPTDVCEIDHGAFRRYTLDPKDYGFDYVPLAELVGGDAQVNKAITEAVLRGESGGPRTVVLLNAGMALYLAGKTDTYEAGIRLAEHTIDSGAALAQLERFVKRSQELAQEGA